MCQCNRLYNNASLTQYDSGRDMASVQISVQEDLADKIENAKWEIKYKLRLEIQNTDVLNALIYHHLKNLTEDEVLEYRRKILGKDE